MNWIYLALLSYLINAIVFVVDKYLLSSSIPKPFAYAFWVSILSISVAVLIPFGVIIPSWSYLTVALLSGVASFVGLIFLYKAVIISDVSVASTKVGAASVMSGYLFSLVFFPEVTSSLNFVSFVFFFGGVLLLAKVDRRILGHAIVSGIFLSLSLILLKSTFNMGGLVNGVFWSRFLFGLVGIVSLTVPAIRKEVFHTTKTVPRLSGLIFVSNKLLAGIGFGVLYSAVYLGDVASVNAFQGFQFIFIFGLSFLVSLFLPKLRENYDKSILIPKLLGITLIVIGFFLS